MKDTETKLNDEKQNIQRIEDIDEAIALINIKSVWSLVKETEVTFF